MTSFFSSISKTLQQHRHNLNLSQNTVGDPLCLVSGGPDSIVLVFVILQSFYKNKKDIDLVYCHHFWQSQNFVAFWQLWKLSFLFKLPYTIILAEKNVETETSACLWRQESANRITYLLDRKSLYKGHTLTDKIETFFLLLFRGTSPLGLFQSYRDAKGLFDYYTILFKKENFFLYSSTLYYSQCRGNKTNYTFHFNKKGKAIVDVFSNSTFSLQPIREHYKKTHTRCLFIFYSISMNEEFFIYRPLTNISRSEISEIISQFRLPSLIDPTNTYLKTVRNRIRYQLSPIIRYFFTKKLEKSVDSFLQSNALLHDYIENNLNILLLEYLSKSEFESIFNHFPKYIQRYILKFLYRKYSSRTLHYTHIQILESTILRKK